MSATPARDALRNVICAQASSNTDAETKLDQHAAEVEEARDEVVVAWLGKKSREYRNTGTRQGALQADAVAKMADKLRRGAARKNNLLGAPELTVYRAQHDSIVMGLYTTAAAARAHCEGAERSSWPTGTNLTFDWIEDEEDGVVEMTVFAGQNDESTTGYVVTPLTVAAAYDEEADE